MIDKFVVGKYYRCILKERPEGWNSGGRMDKALDGKPRKCICATTVNYVEFLELDEWFEKNKNNI